MPWPRTATVSVSSEIKDALYSTCASAARQGGILVYDPASGIVIQENAFDNNNPPAGRSKLRYRIYGSTAKMQAFPQHTGVQHITVVWNTFFNNCAAISSRAYPDSVGRCAATWVNAYIN